MSCGCCSRLQPRYKRLVDDIFPYYPEDGLVKSNMEKLIYYAINSPEKLDRIGEFLAYRIGRFNYRGKEGFVEIGMEAMDDLLMACPRQTLNLYVQSYLKTIQKLLESPQPQLQILASQSFLMFAKKEEEVPAYHRSYDFFIGKFSQMCLYETNDPEITKQIRISGLQGIRGVIRKTVNEDLAENIWSASHMDKIVPSLLYNIQIDFLEAGRTQTPDLDAMSNSEMKSPRKVMSPLKIAEDTLRDLVGRASFNNIRSVMPPVLAHFDQHRLWNITEFQEPVAEHIFQVIMFGITGHHYVIVEMLIRHLDKLRDNHSSLDVRCGVATVLSAIFTSGGPSTDFSPSVLETINSLYTHLRSSVKQSSTTAELQRGHMRQDSSCHVELHPDAQRYHEALLSALGAYTNSLPNFQKLEIMMFILGKAPSQPSATSQMDCEMQHMALKALYYVAEKYQSMQFSTTFPTTFLTHLLSMLRSPDADVRLLVLHIFQTLIDRNQNAEKLSKPTLDPRSDLFVQKPNANKQDNKFFAKHGDKIYTEMFRAIRDETNAVKFLEQIWATCSLLIMECNSDENVALLINLIRDVQNLANVLNVRLSVANRFSLHALCMALYSLLAFTLKLPDISDHKDILVSLRRRKAPHLLPPFREDYSPNLDPHGEMEEFLIDLDPIRTALTDAGRNINRDGGVAITFRKSVQSSSPRSSTRSSTTESLRVTRKPSSLSVASFNVDVDLVDVSGENSPQPPKKSLDDLLSFNAMKRASAEPTPQEKEEKERANKNIVETFQTLNFSDLCDVVMAGREGETLQEYIADLFDKKNVKKAIENNVHKPVHEDYFPELFRY